MDNNNRHNWPSTSTINSTLTSTANHNNCQHYHHYHYYGSLSITTSTSTSTTTTTTATTTTSTTKTIPDNSNQIRSSSYYPLLPISSTNYCDNSQRINKFSNHLTKKNIPESLTKLWMTDDDEQYSNIRRHHHRHKHPYRHQHHNDTAAESTCFLEDTAMDETNLSGSFVHQEFRPSISRALEYCHNEVLPPYRRLLKLLGWQPFQFDCSGFDCCKILINSLHIMFLFLIICIGHLLQYASCFRQDSLGTMDIFDAKILNDNDNAAIIDLFHQHFHLETNQSYQFFNLTKIFKEINHELASEIDEQIFMNRVQIFLHCKGSAMAHYFLPGIIHLVSFAIILKHLRFCEVDRFQNLCLLNLLLATKIIGHKKASIQIKKIVRNWIVAIFLCLLLIIIQFAIRLFIFDDVSFGFIDAEHLQWLPKPLLWLKSFCFILFSFIELIHISIIIIYALYCQMNILFIQMNVTAIREKRINFQEFAKNTEIFKMNINFLNNRYSLSVSLLMIYITAKASVTMLDMFAKYSYVGWHLLMLAISSMIYWSLLLSVPLLQAARLTNACQSIIDIGHELCARPFCYQQTARDDLDSLLTYTSSLNLKARLLMIPVRPSFIISIFLVLIFIILILSQFHLIDL
ncbi:Nucleolar protein 10 [Dermatophagoides farinae]|uniref:Nucleolar protein 10 n=1 Tax=Dermatophagoides farinae TaxID=6954 RepID=A0A922HQ53_DERFA|nr:Nucleolar protein 10 [Dermatophagoides farinae]